MRRAFRLVILGGVVVGALGGLAGSGLQGGPRGETRHYYVQAENEEWTIVPSGYEDDKLGRRVEGSETRFTAIVLRGYQDAAFSRPKARPPWAGILGPTIEARVGDRVVVHFRNADFGYNRPHSLHVHGLRYTFPHDGGYMPHLGREPGTAVPPGGTFSYEWEAGPDSAGTWFYHDHSTEAEDSIRRGMLAAVVVRRPDERPAREFTLVFSSFTRATTRLRRDFFTINGRAFMGNLPGIEARVGDRVRFRVIAMGDDFHTFHLHGHRWTLGEQVVDNVPVAPASTATFEFVEDAPGVWMLHCHVIEHMENGMMQHYTVLPR